MGNALQFGNVKSKAEDPWTFSSLLILKEIVPYEQQYLDVGFTEFLGI